MERTPAIQPLEQAAISFFGNLIRAVRLPDGRIAAVFTDLCTALNLNRVGQIQRIRADEMLAEQVLFCLVALDNGETQPMDALTAWAIPTWLHGVQLSRLAPEKRPAILAFKREAADVLYRHFSEHRTAPPLAALPEPQTIVPTGPIQEPARPAADAGRSTWIDYHHAMAAWLEWQEDMERWRGAVESRLETVEEVTRLIPEILDRLGPQMLTPEHQATTKAMAGRLHDLGGTGYATIYSELNAAFHVGKYSDIPEVQWPEVAVWFQVRIDAAERRRNRQ